MEGIGTIPSDRPTLTNSYTIPEGEKSTITIDFIKTGPISTIFGEIQLAGPYMEMKIAGALAAQYVFSGDRKSTRLNSSHLVISYAVFCLKKKKKHEPKLVQR